MGMHRRIQTEGVEYYNRIKNLAEENDHFKPYLRWFHGLEEKLSDHEKQVQKKFTALLGSTLPDGSSYQYRDIAEVAGCSATTVSKVMNGHNQLSKELADEILKNLHKQEKS